MRKLTENGPRRLISSFNRLEQNSNWQKDSKENFQHTTSFILQKKYILTCIQSAKENITSINVTKNFYWIKLLCLWHKVSGSFLNTINIGRHFPSELCRKNIGLLADTFCFDDQFVYQWFFFKAHISKIIWRFDTATECNQLEKIKIELFASRRRLQNSLFLFIIFIKEGSCTLTEGNSKLRVKNVPFLWMKK